jgi:hypothetical protein
MILYTRPTHRFRWLYEWQFSGTAQTEEKAIEKAKILEDGDDERNRFGCKCEVVVLDDIQERWSWSFWLFWPKGKVVYRTKL